MNQKTKPKPTPPPRKHQTRRDPKARSIENTVISVAVPTELKDRAISAAQADGRKLSDWLRWQLKQWVDEEFEPQRRPH